RSRQPEQEAGGTMFNDGGHTAGSGGQGWYPIGRSLAEHDAIRLEACGNDEEVGRAQQFLQTVQLRRIVLVQKSLAEKCWIIELLRRHAPAYGQRGLDALSLQGLQGIIGDRPAFLHPLRANEEQAQGTLGKGACGGYGWD